MSVDAGTAPEALMTVETGPIYAELRKRILSGEVKLNFSYLPPRAIEPEHLNINPTEFSLADDDRTEEELLGEIDGLLDKLGSGEFFTYLPPRAIGPENLNIDPTKFPLVDPNKPPERIIYL